MKVGRRPETLGSERPPEATRVSEPPPSLRRKLPGDGAGERQPEGGDKRDDAKRRKREESSPETTPRPEDKESPRLQVQEEWFEDSYEESSADEGGEQGGVQAPPNETGERIDAFEDHANSDEHRPPETESSTFEGSQAPPERTLERPLAESTEEIDRAPSHEDGEQKERDRLPSETIESRGEKRAEGSEREREPEQRPAVTESEQDLREGPNQAGLRGGEHVEAEQPQQMERAPERPSQQPLKGYEKQHQEVVDREPVGRIDQEVAEPRPECAEENLSEPDPAEPTAPDEHESAERNSMQREGMDSDERTVEAEHGSEVEVEQRERTEVEVEQREQATEVEQRERTEVEHRGRVEGTEVAESRRLYASRPEEEVRVIADNAVEVSIRGIVERPSPARENFERALSTAREVKRDGGEWHRCHLWGRTFGKESAAGIMFAPRSFNLAWQGSIERHLREITADAHRRGEAIGLQVTGRSQPRIDSTLYMRGVTYEWQRLDSDGQALEPPKRLTIELPSDPRGRPVVSVGSV